ncbi:MAG: alpha/beta hydrolase [Phycisphaerales bacterium]|nr:alpha/beta hydrolase [Phycisphaerales bacterium]
MSTSNWELPGSRGLPIRGTTHLPEGDPRGTIVIVHGYLGYKDYGMFPWLATRLCEQGHVVHRINLSHSGMDHGHGQFNEQAVEQDTWTCGVEDIRLVLQAISSGRLAGQGRGVVLIGHSRGGSTCLLAVGRHDGDADFESVVGIVSMSGPASLGRLSDEAKQTLLSGGRVEMASSRTGQTLHVGQAWLQEQLDDPEGHDLPVQVSHISRPIGLIHGAEDPTVDPSDAVTIAQANPSRSMVRLIENGDHVFNTPNPFDPDAELSLQLAEVAVTAGEWIDSWVA